MQSLPELPRHVFVDGRDKLDVACDCDAVIGGDGLVLSIAAASIVAKVTRDRLMCALAQDCPGYGFEPTRAMPCPSIWRRWTGSDRAPITAVSSPPWWPRGKNITRRPSSATF